MTAPYRETKVTELCAHCRAPTRKRCRQCSGPYCATHLAAPEYTCSVCLEASFNAGRERRDNVLVVGAFTGIMLILFGTLWMTTGSFVYVMLSVGAIVVCAMIGVFVDWLYLQ